METGPLHSERLAELGADNRALCVAALRHRDGQSIADLAATTGLSRPTVRMHTEAMLEQGLIHAAERTSTSKGGRPASVFSLNPRGALVAVFDVSKHEHRFLLSDLTGDIHAAFVAEVPGSVAITQRADLVKEGLERLAGMAGVPFSTITQFSGSIGAQVSSGGAILRNTGDVSLLDEDFADRFGPVTLENDLKAACYAEQRIGRAQGIRDVVYALAWHRVAAGIVLDGRIRRGAHELAGELNLVDPGVGAPDDEADWADWPSFLEVLRAAEGGDTAAAASVERFCGRSAHQIAMLATSLDPEMIVLGGPLVHRSDFFVDRLTAALDRYLSQAPAYAVQLSALRSWGPALGAMLRGLEALERGLFGVPSFEYTLSNSTETDLPLPRRTRTERAS